MRKVFRASALIIVLSCSANAGVIPNGVTANGVIPNGASADGVIPNGATSTTASTDVAATETDAAAVDSTTGVTEIALDLINSILSLF